MADGQTHTPTSVLLPTVSWADACDEVAAQLEPEGELLVVHDDGDDPVSNREPLPENVRSIRAGDPVGCSGKAKAIAAETEAANHDRLVRTEDDFHRPPDRLDRLHRDHADHGPTTELPAFVGQDPLAILSEPVYALDGTLETYVGDHAWGGAVAFDRSDLDEAAFLSELRRTIAGTRSSTSGYRTSSLHRPGVIYPVTVTPDGHNRPKSAVRQAEKKRSVEERSNGRRASLGRPVDR